MVPPRKEFQMPNNTTVPNGPDPSKIEGPFYLLSRIDNSDWVLTAREIRDANGNPAIDTHITHAKFLPEQLWTRVWSLSGSSYRLVNAKYNRALHFNGLQGQGGPLTLVNLGDADAGQKFVSDTTYGPDWVAITAQIDFQQRVNVAGYPPYDSSRPVIMWEYSRRDPNECWKAAMDFGDFELARIDYDESKLVADLSLPLKEFVLADLDNTTTDSPLSQKVTITSKKSSSTTVTYNVSKTISDVLSVKFGGKAIVKDVFEANEEVTFSRTTSNTVSFGQSQTQSEEETVSFETTISVPARKHYKFWVVVKSGKISVPYVATINRSVGGQAIPFQVSGLYERVNSTSVQVKTQDMKTGALKIETSFLLTPRRAHA